MENWLGRPDPLEISAHPDPGARAVLADHGPDGAEAAPDDLLPALGGAGQPGEGEGPLA